MERLTTKEIIDFNLRFKIVEKTSGIVEQATYTIASREDGLSMDSYSSSEEDSVVIYSIISRDGETLYKDNIPSYNELVAEIKNLMTELKQKGGYQQ